MVEFYALTGADVICVVFVYHIIILSNIAHYNLRGQTGGGKAIGRREELRSDGGRYGIEYDKK